jgi:very-short-patch-repair endonuclease
LQHYVSQEAFEGDDLAQSLRQRFSSQHEPWLAAARALVNLLPVDRVPLLVLCRLHGDSSPKAESHSLTCRAQMAACIACECPELPLALVASEAGFSAYLDESPESFAKAILRQGQIVVRSPTEDELVDRFRKRVGCSSEPWQDSLRQLAAVGADEEVADCFAEAVAAGLAQQRSPEDSQQADAARSTAERFLYELLRDRPQTSGLFALNVRPGFYFGSQVAELDLASQDLQIAVEVDGYYHFQDASAYRRDRRKDFLLQREGYFVLRFLADDVVREMETILGMIDEAVAHRRNLHTNGVAGTQTLH